MPRVAAVAEVLPASSRRARPASRTRAAPLAGPEAPPAGTEAPAAPAGWRAVTGTRADTLDAGAEPAAPPGMEGSAAPVW